MNTNILIKIFCGSALMQLASCPSDNLIDDKGNTLPEGKYPLEIASVSLSAEVTDEPWGASHTPQTRVAESPDGGSGMWQEEDEIQVQIGSGDLGTYKLVSQTQIDGNPPAYWLSTQRGQSVTAWYPAKTEYNGIGKCWEANVVPNHAITEYQLNETIHGILNDSGITPKAANINTITLTIGETTMNEI